MVVYKRPGGFHSEWIGLKYMRRTRSFRPKFSSLGLKHAGKLFGLIAEMLWRKKMESRVYTALCEALSR